MIGERERERERHQSLLSSSHPARVTSTITAPGFLDLSNDSRAAADYNIFQRLVIQRLTAISNEELHGSEFWPRTVMREASRDECVHHAALALGALARAQQDQQRQRGHHDIEQRRVIPLFKSRPTVSSVKAGTAGGMQDHYYHALVYYTKAINVFRRRIAALIEGSSDDASGGGGKGEKTAPRTILISTLALVAFELQQGNTEAADQLVAHCLSFLRGTIMQGYLVEEDQPEATHNLSSSHHQTSLIARDLDDEGTREAEAELVRSCCINAAFSPLYPHVRRVLVGLPIPSFEGPLPPPGEASVQDFCRNWTRVFALVLLWYFRMHISMARLTPQMAAAALACSSGEDDSSVLEQRREWLRLRRTQQYKIKMLLETWKAAVKDRLASLTSSSTMTTTTTYVRVYRRVAVVMDACYYSVCTVFDAADGFQGYQHAAARLLTQCEDLLSERVIETSNGATQSSTGGSKVIGDFREQGVVHGGVMTVVAQIAQESRHPELRWRAMRIWDQMAASKTATTAAGEARTKSSKRSRPGAWEVQAAHLSIKAVLEAEEQQRDPVKGTIPLEAQWFPSGGEWNDDYTVFHVTLTAKVPGLDGRSTQRVMSMPVED